MKKLKKALKKIAGLGLKAALPAKKAPAMKKKTQSLNGGKKITKPVMTKKIVAAAPKKVQAKPAKPTKAVAGKPTKPEAKKKLSAAPPKPVKVPQKKQTAVPAPTPAKVANVKKPAPAEAAAASAAPMKAKSKKGRDEAIETATQATDEEVILTDADGRRYCRVKDCDQAAVVDGGYCRFHYLLFWKNIQNRKKILSEGKLERYIEELTARYPDKYLELLRKDLRSEKDFSAAIQELEIDESGVDNEFEDEAQTYLEEVRGISGSEPTNEREEDF